MRKFKVLTFVILAISISHAQFCSAFDDKTTHREITKRAVQQSNLNNYLTTMLGISEGIDKFLKNGDQNLKIAEWLQEGSELEDSPICRPSNHFHNPLKLWDQSYMTDQPWWLDLYCSSWNPRYSNVTWGTCYISPAPDGSKITISTQQMGWDNAREYYHLALTSQSSADRETNFAKTFQALGQVIPLIEDMEVSAYVRRGV